MVVHGTVTVVELGHYSKTINVFRPMDSPMINYIIFFLLRGGNNVGVKRVKHRLVLPIEPQAIEPIASIRTNGIYFVIPLIISKGIMLPSYAALSKLAWRPVVKKNFSIIVLISSLCPP